MPKKFAIPIIMEKQNVDPTLTQFLTNLSYIALLTFVILAALGMLGIQTTSFIDEGTRRAGLYKYIE